MAHFFDVSSVALFEKWCECPWRSQPSLLRKGRRGCRGNLPKNAEPGRLPDCSRLERRNFCRSGGAAVRGLMALRLENGLNKGLEHIGSSNRRLLHSLLETTVKGKFSGKWEALCSPIADLLYKANMNTGSVLEYALAFTSAALDKYCSKWSAIPKTGFVDITTSKDFYRIYSGLQIGYLEESEQVSSGNRELLGDSVAWGGCTIIYLLGQQIHFELFDFSHQVLNVAEVETVSSVQSPRNPQFSQGWEVLIESMKKARRLNNHVFSMLKARCPLEDKTACAIKQSGAPLHRIKFENTISAFETLPQKGA
ncbi:hypothetical protein F8388_012705 [Cannabis sativa]|uniref:Uncharacterized protein n=1 Tax=Cannabis sativa TaxID=3483 RepID=A0A7J6HCM5_CANSA|nr:hypothetical protein F8388_012705 [Cannabis sativa]